MYSYAASICIKRVKFPLKNTCLFRMVMFLKYASGFVQIAQMMKMI